jgi:hypothetical protein
MDVCLYPVNDCTADKGCRTVRYSNMHGTNNLANGTSRKTTLLAAIARLRSAQVAVVAKLQV